MIYVSICFFKKCSKTKISLTHPYPYSFHKNHSLCTIETSCLSLSFLFMLHTQLRVGKSFQSFSLRAKCCRIEIIEGLRSAHKPNTVLISKCSHVSLRIREELSVFWIIKLYVGKNAYDCCCFTPRFY